MLRTLVRFTLCFFWLPLAVAQEGYQQPAAALAAIVDAPLAPELTLSPSRDRALLLARSPAPTIAELAAPELRLAGVRFNPGSLTSNRATDFTQLTFKLLADGRELPVAGFPAHARFAHVAWSPDGRHLSVVVFVGENPGALWIVDVAAAQARALTGPQLNGVLGNPVDWLDRDTLLVKMIPRDHGAPPARTVETLGPIAQQSTGKRAAARTYTDLLNGPQDEAEFEYYGTAELVRVGLDGSTHPLGLRGLLEASPSPDGRFILVTSLHRPFSYALPASRFPQRIEVYSRDGQLVHTLAALPMADSITIDFNSVRRGPREVTWRHDAPATLAWFEARDGGDATSDAKVRDELLMLAAPFTDAPQSLMKFALRAGSMIWGDDQRMLVTESWRRTRRTRTWLLNPAQPGSEPRLVFDRSSENLYEHPGDPILERGTLGRPQLRFTADGTGIFLRGTGASPEGNRPFLDQLDLTTLRPTRLWQSAAPHYEEFIAFLDASGQRTLTRRESVTDAPNYFVRDLARGTSEPFTAFANPFPQFAGVHKELISYARADGVTLTGTLYLPPGWQPAAGPLPTLLWAYPREFKSADAASQVRASPYRFVRVSASGPLPYLLLGYAVLDDPAMPIIGEGKREPNDTYVTQLVSSARAAIEELARRGVTDPQRVAVGGHSYGAFMTANLLAHSDLFRAGIARSGAYNRTLTPFGFQAETRNFWKAPDIYAAMSPFNHADKIKDPLLLVHGQADNNQGTFPIQSERMFQALRGLGATSRYVQLPHESHGYRARESLLHVLWETATWLDTYVKTPPSRDKRK
ncbi:MAG: prolyl oligopeptidase family serine peptidase [Candidatus Didemnitutus sp.]|nr:prolyl oligopeptidase family serine peptidase [Candidatus Didemnitutus sp.]